MLAHEDERVALLGRPRDVLALGRAASHPPRRCARRANPRAQSSRLLAADLSPPAARSAATLAIAS
ncbi:MAG: hypothetical protein ACPG4T_06700, partial [Nannocystaceae bacterium]